MSFKVVLVLNPVNVPADFADKVKNTGAEFVMCGDLKTEDEVLSACIDADYIMTVVRLHPFTPRVLKELIKCKFIETLGIGYEGINLNTVNDLGIGIIHARGFCVQELAEHAMALMLAHSRCIIELNKNVKNSRKYPTITEYVGQMGILQGKTLGIIGFGNAGKSLVPLAKGFGMKILAFDQYVPKNVFKQYNVENVSFNRLLEESDYISIHANLTSEARHMFGKEQFKMMKPNAFIVNTARGGFIDENALCKALTKGYIAGAGLDVTDPDPPPSDSPLFNFKNVIMTGHMAGNSAESQEKMWSIPIEELTRVMRNEWPYRLVNPAVKEKYILKWGAMSEPAI